MFFFFLVGSLCCCQLLSASLSTATHLCSLTAVLSRGPNQVNTVIIIRSPSAPLLL